MNYMNKKYKEKCVDLTKIIKIYILTVRAIIKKLKTPEALINPHTLRRLEMVAL